MSTELESLRDRLSRLQALHEGGTLGDEAYAKGREALERQIIEQVMAGPPEVPQPLPTPEPRRRGALWLVLGVGVLVAAAAGVAWIRGDGTGATTSAGAAGVRAPDAAPPADSASAPGHALGTEQIAAMVDKLSQRLKDHPEDAEGWAMLARSYAQLGRHADALPAYAKAVSLRDKDAQLLADYADALAMKQGKLLDGEPLVMVKRALKVDPDNVKALALAGTAAFAAQDYAGAVAHWERLARVGPRDNPLVQQIQVSIDEARSLGKLPTASGTASAPAR